MQPHPLLLALALTIALVAAGALWWTDGGVPAELRGIALNEPRPLPTFRRDAGEGETLEELARVLAERAARYRV
ncbi:MAG: hypothetical protein ACQERG_04350 [Pseudomonadota bacterium]